MITTVIVLSGLRKVAYMTNGGLRSFVDRPCTEVRFLRNKEMVKIVNFLGPYSISVAPGGSSAAPLPIRSVQIHPKMLHDDWFLFTEFAAFMAVDVCFVKKIVQKKCSREFYWLSI